jgi:hemolysin activation/secretion protein
MNNKKYTFLTIILVCMAPAWGLNANEAGHVPQETNQFLEQAQKRRDAIEHAQRERQLQRGMPGTSPADSSPPEPEESPDAPCWYLTGVQLSGNHVIGEHALRKVMQPLLKPCMSPGRVNRLLAAITRLYTDAGYVTSRPVLLAPPADHQPLTLAVDEGFVEAITLADADLPVSLRSAFPGMIGKPLHLRDLERGLDQLNRLRSVDLAADIEPGALPGGSRIVLRAVTRPSRWQWSGLLDNGGSPGTGRDRVSISTGLDNPLELNDTLGLYGARSQGEGQAGSQTLGLYYSLPYGKWTLALAANRFQFRSAYQGMFSTLRTSGTTTLLSYSLEHALWRDQSRLVSTSLRLDDKRHETRFQTLYLPFQSPRYQTLEAGLNGLWIGQATWSGFVGHAWGLGGWRSDDGLPHKAPAARTARYSKWRASISRTASPTVGGLHWAVQSTWQGQYSADALPATEALSLGDPSLIRGFRHQGIETSNGVAWRNTLYLPVALGPRLSLTPSLGLDLGWADGRGRDARRVDPAPVRGEQLAGASLGMALEHPYAALTAEYQRGLYRRNGPLQPGYWQLALQLKL